MAFNSFLNNSIKILLVLLISIMLIIGTIFVLPPSFADDTVDFSLQPIPVGDTSSSLDSGLAVGTYNNSTYYVFTNYDNMYYFVYSGRTYLVTDTLIEDYYYLYGNLRRTMTTNSQIYSGINNWTYYEDYDLYLSPVVRDFGGYYTSLDYTFTDITSGLSAIREYLDRSVSSFVSYPNTVTVRAGYVAYVLTNGGSANITATFPKLSKFAARPLWPDSLATLTYSSDLPSSGTVFSSTLGGLIDWLIPASAPKNALGQTHIGGIGLDECPDDAQYVVIYNPAYMADGSASPTISAYFSNFYAVRQYPIVTSYNNGEYTSTSDNSYRDSYLAIGGDDFTTNSAINYHFYTTDQLGNVTSSSAISIPDNNSNIVTDSTGDNSIQGLVNKITELLSAPVKHIQNLINAGQEFMSNFSNLYSWLPEPVLTVLISALVLVVVIGVIKLLH